MDDWVDVGIDVGIDVGVTALVDGAAAGAIVAAEAAAIIGKEPLAPPPPLQPASAQPKTTSGSMAP